MTTTDTMDTRATVEQTLRMVEAGCEYVRITAPSKKEAENLANIKRELRARGCQVPLVADIHYTPNAAEIAARIVEKVRVNPGNYADKKRFENITYTDEAYQAELERIYSRFAPLVRICKEYGTVLRIGTNHGSLSDRIMSRYGDTPLGMVESAMEFVRICEDLGFRDIVISMKASNPQVMVQAYRMLMQHMLAEGNVYPLHLGVTEAGEGEDGRIKSALGIASLLWDGIGDTVRVSLTEDPEFEPPVAAFLIRHVVRHANEKRSGGYPEMILPFNPLSFQRKDSQPVHNLGSGNVPRVVAGIRHNCTKPENLEAAGYTYVPALDKYNFSEIASDFVFLGDHIPAYSLPGGLNAVYEADTWNLLRDDGKQFPFFASWKEWESAGRRSDILNFVGINPDTVKENDLRKTGIEQVVFILESDSATPVYDWRWMIYRLMEAGIRQPLLVRLRQPSDFSYFEQKEVPATYQIGMDSFTQLSMASDISTLLVDGLLDGIWLDETDTLGLRTVFGMLQLSRLRITKTEYISCPSCGRTLFDLQETTARIRKRTEHLKGVKIGIMGCIVNGPGEMADADYGYVGVGPDKIALYRGQEVVEKGIGTKDAVDRLIGLIREDGKWVEP
jgi:(E)-4-hydroxy-3-methylbut-2-enyl-diphosphate synthase